MNEYIHSGEALPGELLDRIADDVRLFDMQRAPEMRIAKALEKLADRALRVKFDVSEAERELETDHARARDSGNSSDRACLSTTCTNSGQYGGCSGASGCRARCGATSRPMARPA